LKNKVLITGHKGFVGTYLCTQLSQLAKVDNAIELVIAEETDFCCGTSVQALPQVSLIIHLAAKTFIPESFLKPTEYYQNNINSTLNILEKARRDCAKVIFLSTYIYGTPEYLPIDELHPAQPLNPYTQSKLICEQLCAAYARDFSLRVTVLRPFNIYGPGQASHFFIPTIIAQIDQPEIRLQNSKPKRDYIFIQDLVDVIILFVKENFIGFEVYNVGSGTSYSVNEVVTRIMEITKSKATIHYTDKARHGEVNNCIASIEKLYKKYKWKPRFSIEEGLRQVIKINNKHTTI